MARGYKHQPSSFHPALGTQAIVFSNVLRPVCITSPSTMLPLSIMATLLYTVVLAVASADSNVKHNHALFNGILPPPAVFGLHGYVPLSKAGHEVPEGTKIYADLANANGTGPHVDFIWMRHGIPSYLTTKLNLSRESVEQNHYRIVMVEGAARVELDAVASAQNRDAADLKTRDVGDMELQDCFDLPPLPQGAATAVCHNNHGALLRDCDSLYWAMTDEFCNDWDEADRVYGIQHSCAIVAKRARLAATCFSIREAASYALPIIHQCWGTLGRCNIWRSGVIQGNNYAPKSCVCNNESIGAC